MPRTILGPIDGNKRFNHELYPYKRGKIVGAVSQGASFTDTGKLVHRPGSTARATVKHDTERHDGHTRELIHMGDNEDAYQALYTAMKEGWESIPQEKIDNLIKELGFNMFIDRRGDRERINITVQNAGKKTSKTLELDPDPIAHQRAIVCRGTTCYRAKLITSKAQPFNYVVKLLWRSVERKGEGELLELAKERKVEGVAKLIYHCDIISIANLRSGLTFGTYYQYPSDDATSLAPNTGSPPSSLRLQTLGMEPPNPSSLKRSASTSSRQTMPKKTKLSDKISAELNDAPTEDSGASNVQDGTLPRCKTNLTDTDSKPFQDRMFSCLTISPAGKALRNYNSVKEFLKAFRDAICGHRSLYNDGRILHRDVSENNLIIIDGSRVKGPKGMLIDLDLGKERDSKPSGARFRTGTMQFMAIEVLNGLPHTYRHDLESFFYVFLWICIRRGWENYSRKTAPKDYLLTDWYTVRRRMEGKLV